MSLALAAIGIAVWLLALIRGAMLLPHTSQFRLRVNGSHYTRAGHAARTPPTSAGQAHLRVRPTWSHSGARGGHAKQEERRAAVRGGLARCRTGCAAEPPLRCSLATAGQLHLHMRHTERARPSAADVRGGKSAGPGTAEGLARRRTARATAARPPTRYRRQKPANCTCACDTRGRARASVAARHGWEEQRAAGAGTLTVAGQLRMQMRHTQARSGEPGGQARRVKPRDAGAGGACALELRQAAKLTTATASC
jgi:hypothetical protein